MSKKRKVYLALLLSLVMLLSLFSGCGQTTTPAATAAATAAATTPAATAATPAATAAATTAESAPAETGALLPISKEMITLKVFWPAPANVLKFITDFNEASIYPVLEKQTNVHIEWQHGTVEQYSLMINSGDLPDIIFAPDASYIYPGGGEKAVVDGVYLKLNDYLDKYCMWYPKLINSTPEFKRNSRTDSGTIWGFAMVETKSQGPFMGMTVRQDWLDDLGLATPETYEDWHQMLIKFKTEKNATAPMLLPKELFDWCDSMISGYNVGKGFYQVDKKVKYGPIEPGFKQYITMLAQWYSEGLIDKDFATRDAASMDQLKYTKKAGAWFDGFWMLNFNKIHSEDMDVFQQYAVSNPVPKKGDIAHLRQVNYNIRDEWTAVSAKSKYPVEAVRWLDNLYSDSNYVLTNYGVEGEGYIKKDGEYKFTPLVTANPDGLVFAEALYRYAMHDGPMWRDCYSYINSADPKNPVSTPDEIAAEAIWYKADASYVIPMISLTAEEATSQTTIMSDITTYVTEMSTKYVMGVEDIGTFDQFVAQIKSMKIDDAIALEQAAVDRYYKR